MTSKLSTQEKIIDAAEDLFADRGFAETSLRIITARAEVNLASVNYHFGSKKSLIQAVFDRFMRKFCDQLLRELEVLEKQVTDPAVEQVLETLIAPLLLVDKSRKNGSSVFMRLLGRAYAETQGHLRRFITEKYGHVLERFHLLLHRACPNLSSYEMFWRLHFMLGSVIFTLAGSDALTEISEVDFHQNIDVEMITLKLIPFLAAGMKAHEMACVSINLEKSVGRK